MIKALELEGLRLIHNFNNEDLRGEFIKVYSEEVFQHHRLPFEVKETYYSISKKNVIRGMHFQTPPCEHEKLVHVIKGSVLDVVLDLRKESNTYGQYISVYLDEKEKKALYIPKGFAHGFKSLEDDTVMLYQVSFGYVPECDKGIRWNSFGFDWKTDNPIVSKRDNDLCKFENFNSMF